MNALGETMDAFGVNVWSCIGYEALIVYCLSLFFDKEK